MSQELATRYPLVLVPGMLGFIRLLWFPYWYGITPALRAGGATVFPVQVSPLHCNEVRGEQLLLRIEQIRREQSDWSQPGLADRALRGGPAPGMGRVGDLGGRAQSRLGTGRSFPAALSCAVARLMGWLETGYRGPALPMDLSASHHSLTSDGVALFNRQYPQGLPDRWGGQGAEWVDGVRYYSWSGILQPGITDRGRNLFDGTHRSCRLFAKTFIREAGQCDGMVGRYSSHLGTVIGDDYPLDHLDIVNQSLGLVGKGAEPIRLFVEHAQRLKAEGL